ncbi:single-stranded-DNA-specific exonuclease RecJ [Helicobacter cholecystus]|uniref:Single-stranded-DNA-specific exonuclease RecJ n=1 Tax=Helicobacter cholecystus TaxID=45498 RepID=A0A3D8IUW4_9HELI|nr:single-stranded-DNA-specific exonuclease RecJ [Helicobacter cholecystus]RDU69022.1 single-stranded-DNA-specific exonuclease RecJ [Helicobacter cholecystus]VEJ24548.1 single-stranded DNA-specific exonuclease [Helicobacter cholecystus]
MLDLSQIHSLLSLRFENQKIANLKSLPPPFCLKNVKEGSELVKNALLENKRILIVGDYDADGILSTAVMVRFFQAIGVKNFSYVIPNRFSDGYGISEGVLAKEERADLIITVDNGITALEVAEECKKRGQTLIITDHHMPKDQLPDALIINPRVSGFVQEEICGCLVAWYFCAGIKQVLGVEFDLSSLIEFVGIAIVSDVMPLVEMNRSLLKFAIKKYPTSPYPCFQVLKKVYKEIDGECISYYISPLLNASGRMGEADVALKFILSETLQEAQKYYKSLQKLNAQRKQIQASLEQIALQQAIETQECVIAYGEDWHEGILGILAGRLAGKFGKPAFVLSAKNGKYQGSARSANGVNLLKSVEQLPRGVCEFGGHSKAMGICISAEYIQDFVSMFKAYYEEEQENKEVLGEIGEGILGNEMLRVIESFAPYGEGNPEPIFSIRELQIIESKKIGKEKEHTSLKCRAFGRPIKAVAFFKDIEEVEVIYNVNFYLKKDLFTQQPILHIQNYTLCHSLPKLS